MRIMIFDLTPQVFLHVVISLIGLGSGFVVLYGLLTAKRFDTWTAVFLASTVQTSLSGFTLPADQFLPSHAVGILSMIVLTIAIFARYARHLSGAWRWIYVVTALAALYLNTFVFVVQSFLKVPALKALAPTQTEPPFALIQLAVLVLFLALGTFSVIRFRRESFQSGRLVAS
jgi:hypothetical protein